MPAMQLIYLAIFLLTISTIYGEVRNELVLLGDDKIGEVVKTRMVYKKASELPAHWDYREQGLLTTDLNQHIPTYW